MKLALAIIILLLFPLMVSVNGNSSQPQSAGMRNIAIQIMVSPTTYDAFVSWITPFTANFHNFTIIVELANGNYDWFLKNMTRVNFLTSIGEVIPDISYDYIQRFAPNNQTYFGVSRNDILNLTLNEWNSTFGTSSHFIVPDGIFMYQPDTYFTNQAYERGVNFIAGYCFDQYQVDYMSMRGGWQLPYYASSTNALAPENTTSGGIVVLPWLTWDWIDSFTLSHFYESECYGSPASNVSDYVTKLVEDSSSAGSPFGYATFGFSFDWYYSEYVSSGYPAINYTATVLLNLLSNSTYQKYSDGNFTAWFKNNYASTPTYDVNFTSPNSGQTIEWYYDNESRIACYNGTVICYVDYTRQQPDKYLTDVATVNFSMPTSNTNLIDNSLQFTIDALGGGKNRATVVSNGIPYSGMLSDFPEYYHLQSLQLQRSRIGLIVLFVVCLALIVAGIIAVHKHRVVLKKKTETRR
jgi:hypothetical protein